LDHIAAIGRARFVAVAALRQWILDRGAKWRVEMKASEARRRNERGSQGGLRLITLHCYVLNPS